MDKDTCFATLNCVPALLHRITSREPVRPIDTILLAATLLVSTLFSGGCVSAYVDDPALQDQQRARYRQRDKSTRVQAYDPSTQKYAYAVLPPGTRRCPDCRGIGVLGQQRCRLCRGKGWAPRGVSTFTGFLPRGGKFTVDPICLQRANQMRTHVRRDEIRGAMHEIQRIHDRGDLTDAQRESLVRGVYDRYGADLLGLTVRYFPVYDPADGRVKPLDSWARGYVTSSGGLEGSDFARDPVGTALGLIMDPQAQSNYRIIPGEDGRWLSMDQAMSEIANAQRQTSD